MLVWRDTLGPGPVSDNILGWPKQAEPLARLFMVLNDDWKSPAIMLLDAADEETGECYRLSYEGGDTLDPSRPVSVIARGMPFKEWHRSPGILRIMAGALIEAADEIERNRGVKWRD